MGKSNFIEKITCPFHMKDGNYESTPSLAIYDDGHYYCYSCHKSGLVRELGMAKIPKPKPQVRESVRRSVAHIRKLPRKMIRGFEVPVDDTYWYLLWPNQTLFYLKRRLKDTGGPKYLAPFGHTRPLYVPRQASTGVLWFVEGELNALSIAQVVSDTVASPGGVGAFASFRKNFFDQFSTVYLIADNDEPGERAALQLGNMLTEAGKKVSIFLWSQDANQLWVEHGKEKLRAEVEECVRKAQQEAS